MLFAATAMPVSSNYGNELLASVLSESARVVEFFQEVAATDSYEIIQNVQDKLLWMHPARRGCGRRMPRGRAAADRLEVLLKNFIQQPRIDSHTEFVLAALRKERVARIFNFVDERLSFAGSREKEGSYEPSRTNSMNSNLGLPVSPITQSSCTSSFCEW
jgi:hypothetical protein